MQNGGSNFKKEFKQRLYRFVLDLIKFAETLPKDVVSEVVVKQIVRSGTSILANYVEASSASSRRDFANFFVYSLKSANESKMWLAILRDTGRGNQKKLEWLVQELEELSNILASSILTLKKKS